MRAQILMGSAQVFMEQGTAAPSVATLLDRTGVSRATFYAYFSSKEAVISEIYELGVSRLLARCAEAYKHAMSVERFMDACIDAHLESAWQLPRLVYVLGGDAQRPDSALYPTRVGALNRLTEWVQSLAKEAPYDPLLLRAVILSLELIVRVKLQECDEGMSVDKDAIAHMRTVMTRLVKLTLTIPAYDASPRKE